MLPFTAGATADRTAPWLGKAKQACHRDLVGQAIWGRPAALDSDKPRASSRSLRLLERASGYPPGKWERLEHLSLQVVLKIK